MDEGRTRLVVIPAEELEELIRRAVEPLRLQVERLGADRPDGAVTISEAARRLGRTVRHVQRCLRDGRLEEMAPVAGVRMVRWPSSRPGRGGGR